MVQDEQALSGIEYDYTDCEQSLVLCLPTRLDDFTDFNLEYLKTATMA